MTRPGSEVDESPKVHTALVLEWELCHLPLKVEQLNASGCDWCWVGCQRCVMQCGVQLQRKLAPLLDGNHTRVGPFLMQTAVSQ